VQINNQQKYIYTYTYLIALNFIVYLYTNDYIHTYFKNFRVTICIFWVMTQFTPVFLVLHESSFIH